MPSSHTHSCRQATMCRVSWNICKIEENIYCWSPSRPFCFFKKTCGSSFSNTNVLAVGFPFPSSFLPKELESCGQWHHWRTCGLTDSKFATANIAVFSNRGKTNHMLSVVLQVKHEVLPASPIWAETEIQAVKGDRKGGWLTSCLLSCLLNLVIYLCLFFYTCWFCCVDFFYFFLMHTVPQFSIIIVRSFILCLAPKLSHGGTSRTPFFPFPSYQFIAYSVPTQLNTDLKPLPSAQLFHAVWEEQE